MEFINVNMDDHIQTSKSHVDEEDGLFWVNKSQATRPTIFENSSLTKETSSIRISKDNVLVLAAATPVGHLENSSSECSIFDYQQTLEHSSQNDHQDLINSTKSSMQKLMPSTHVAKNHPLNAIIGDVRSGITTRKKKQRCYVKMVANVCYTSTMELATITDALTDDH
ncbi:putative mitochondrial protein [Cucumis melo var. makuwa]|uniref:Mitochondrial protein n=1 Tax=Cucumis melo var. makuwa TaxID=1194695 RepID=A0A5A7VAZ1_CUCMM|nr:putative mitochondrial protein [Cucumis melo var. makuwa]TYK08714.1 putative mitochondrial protein [Cucumis melo var. makuwa]